MAHMSSGKQGQGALQGIKTYHKASAIRARRVLAQEQMDRTQTESTRIVTMFVTVICDKGDILFQLRMNISVINDDGITGHPCERK